MESRRLRNTRESRSTASQDVVKEEIAHTGISAAPGIVIGRAFVVNSETISVPADTIQADLIEEEIRIFKNALEGTREELMQIKASLAAQMGEDHAKIFDAHLLILDDVLVVDDTIELIRAEQRNAAWAFQKVISKVASSFRNIEDEYLKERYVDIVDVKKRVIRRLLGKGGARGGNLSTPSVVVAHDLSPSETAQLDRKLVLGYATDLGGRTSHTAILARSQGVPAVVGLDLGDLVETGDQIIVDGNCGVVVANPRSDTLKTYRREIRRYKEFEKQLLTLTGYPAETLDGRRIELHANIDLPEETRSAVSHGAEGIGLFRTEYFFIAQDRLPTEEEQYQLYRAVVEKMEGKPVTIRVLDIGGDKIVRYMRETYEANRFLGWRGIRFLLTRKDIFKTQLRAIYRASAHGKVKILLPMIVDLTEVTRTKTICDEVLRDLKSGRFKVSHDVKMGIMVETPAAVALADVLSKEVDFFSIGTNDLIQYTMAADRGNARVSNLYQHLHPGVLRFLKMTIDAARKNRLPVAVCGEMSVDPLSTPLLLGLQVDELSCAPNMMPEVKKIIRSVTYDECKSLARRVLRFKTAATVEQEVKKLLKERCPDLSIFQETP